MTDCYFPTLVEFLRWRGTHQPNRIGYTFLRDGESEDIHLTYGELDQRARAVGAELQRAGAAGERVLLLYPSGLEYISGFFGCLYAGAVAVPLYPPRPNRSILRLQSIVANAQPHAVLSTASILPKMEPLLNEVSSPKRLRSIATDALNADSAEQWKESRIRRDTRALLKNTSGPTP